MINKQFYCSCYWRIAFLNMPQNQTLIQFLLSFPTLPFQISHLTLEWSISSNLRPRPSVDRAKCFLRFQICNWFHSSSFPWMNTALQYDLWVHLTAACSEKLQSFVHWMVDPRTSVNCTVLDKSSIHNWPCLPADLSYFLCCAAEKGRRNNWPYIIHSAQHTVGLKYHFKICAFLRYENWIVLTCRSKQSLFAWEIQRPTISLYE